MSKKIKIASSIIIGISIVLSLLGMILIENSAQFADALVYFQKEIYIVSKVVFTGLQVLVLAYLLIFKKKNSGLFSTVIVLLLTSLLPVFSLIIRLFLAYQFNSAGAIAVFIIALSVYLVSLGLLETVFRNIRIFKIKENKIESETK